MRVDVLNWSRRSESNQQPAVYETAALPIELLRPSVLSYPFPYNSSRISHSVEKVNPKKQWPPNRRPGACFAKGA